ncbi:hypothetical protein ACFLY6_00335 [Candidatus Dependentiae bacterium]
MKKLFLLLLAFAFAGAGLKAADRIFAKPDFSSDNFKKFIGIDGGSKFKKTALANIPAIITLSGLSLMGLAKLAKKCPKIASFINFFGHYITYTGMTALLVKGAVDFKVLNVEAIAKKIFGNKTVKKQISAAAAAAAAAALRV